MKLIFLILTTFLIKSFGGSPLVLEHKKFSSINLGSEFTYPAHLQTVYNPHGSALQVIILDGKNQLGRLTLASTDLNLIDQKVEEKYLKDSISMLKNLFKTDNVKAQTLETKQAKKLYHFNIEGKLSNGPVICDYYIFVEHHKKNNSFFFHTFQFMTDPLKRKKYEPDFEIIYKSFKILKKVERQ